MCMLIREVQRDDLDELVRLCEAHAAYEGAKVHFSQSEKQELAKLLFSSKTINCLVVEEASKLLGYATFCIQYATWSAAPYLYLDCLYLRETIRGKGIGQRLMNQIATFMEVNGIAKAQWQTPANNAQAIDFYKNIGANALSKSRFFWEPEKGDVK